MTLILRKIRMPRNSMNLTHMELINRRIAVMDSTAITHCMENNMPILVVNMWDPHALVAALRGEASGHWCIVNLLEIHDWCYVASGCFSKEKMIGENFLSCFCC